MAHLAGKRSLGCLNVVNGEIVAEEPGDGGCVERNGVAEEVNPRCAVSFISLSVPKRALRVQGQRTISGSLDPRDRFRYRLYCTRTVLDRRMLLVLGPKDIPL